MVGNFILPVKLTHAFSCIITSQYCCFFSDGEEPGAHLRKFTPARIFERIGISTALAGPELRKQAQELCPDLFPESSDAEQPTVQRMCGALVAARAARRRQRQNLFTQIGPCRRALCARADLNIRKKLRQLSTKVKLPVVKSYLFLK